MAKKYLIIAIFVVLAAGVLIYFLTSEPSEQPPENQLNSNQDSQAAINQKTAIGEVGEITVKDEQTGEEKPLATPEMPIRITSTIGRIVAVEDNALVVMGAGNSFADGVAREVICLFTDKTITVAKNKTLYTGLSGLNILQKDMEVFVGADENIRGKIEFEVQTIKILK